MRRKREIERSATNSMSECFLCGSESHLRKIFLPDDEENKYYSSFSCDACLQKNQREFEIIRVFRKKTGLEKGIDVHTGVRVK